MLMLHEIKRPIRGYLQTRYSDADLVAALAHARDGKLSFFSCCCVAGVPTAPHALQEVSSECVSAFPDNHIPLYDDFAEAVSDAYSALGEDDDQRRRRLIPMLQAELRRRERTDGRISGVSDSLVSHGRARVSEAPSVQWVATCNHLV